MKCYKLTDKNDQTHGGCHWGENVTHIADGKGELCTSHWIHAYSDQHLAVVLNPIHGNYGKGMHLWECEAEMGEDDNSLKFGTTKLTTIKQVAIPRISKAAKIRFAIYCVLEVYKDKDFKQWADNWLSGENRSEAAAKAAARAAAAVASSSKAATARQRRTAAAEAAWAVAWAAAWAVAATATDLIGLLKKAIKDERG